MSEILLEGEQLRREFAERTAVRNATLQVRAGEVYGLVGPDGAGKTTLIRMLVGVLDPSGGTARIFGQPACSEQVAVRSLVGYMPQQYSLYGDLSVDENLAFFASMFCLDRATFRRRRERLLRLTRLERFGGRRADDLSGGMYKKLALACALLHRPRVLVLDEPTNGVDPVSRRDFWELLGTFVREGMGVLLSTPYMDEASRCARVGLMHEGRILEEGRPLEMLRSFAHRAYRVEGASRAHAATLLEADPAVIALSPSSGGLRVVVEAGQEARIAARLREAEATLVGIRPQFEDVFLTRLHEEARGAREAA